MQIKLDYGREGLLVEVPDANLAGVLGQHSTDKRIDILRRIGAGGSISEAARQAGVSYKAAWQAIETLSNLAGTPLVMKAVGGSGACCALGQGFSIEMGACCDGKNSCRLKYGGLK